MTLNAAPIDGSGLGIHLTWYPDVNETVGLRLWYQSDEEMEWLTWDAMGNDTDGKFYLLAYSQHPALSRTFS